jgi:NAD(P)-dependent dehydrogenase (short-subunit alcohol dehydrogenase family)
MSSPLTGVCVVTGANGGLGSATSLELAKRGATVVMVCRDKDRGEAAKQDVMRRSGSTKVELALADLGSLEEVRRLANDLVARHRSIRALILTAAVYRAARHVTPDGLEEMFATNYLAPHLLTRMILPAIDRGAPARVVIVSAPATTRPDLSDLQGERRFRPLHAFGDSMVEKLLFAFSLSRKIDPSRITIIAFHPGLMKTSLTKEMPGPLRFLANLFSRSPQTAAHHLADVIAGDLPAPNGSFVALSKIRKPPAVAQDRDLQDAMWRASSRLAALAE